VPAVRGCDLAWKSSLDSCGNNSDLE